MPENQLQSIHIASDIVLNTITINDQDVTQQSQRVTVLIPVRNENGRVVAEQPTVCAHKQESTLETESNGVFIIDTISLSFSQRAVMGMNLFIEMLRSNLNNLVIEDPLFSQPLSMDLVDLYAQYTTNTIANTMSQWCAGHVFNPIPGVLPIVRNAGGFASVLMDSFDGSKGLKLKARALDANEYEVEIESFVNSQGHGCKPLARCYKVASCSTLTVLAEVSTVALSSEGAPTLVVA